MKRRLLVLALCAAAGAIATVAAAWRAAHLGVRPGWDRELAAQEAAELWRRYVPAEWGHETIVVDGTLMPPWGHNTISVWWHSGPGVTYVSLSSKAQGRGYSWYCEVVEAGWPFRALVGTEWRQPEGTTRHGLWKTKRRGFTGRGSSPYPYPLRWMWPGFVVDTLIYAAPAWLLSAAVGRIRRRARLDRRLCPQCKYDLRGATGSPTVICPECGTLIAAAWLSRPRQVLRWWLAPAMLPAALLGALLLSGRVTWPLARRQLIWPDPVATCVTIAVFAAAAAGLYVVALRAYGDRSPGRQRLLSLSVAVATAGLALLPLYVLVARIVA